MPGQVLGLPQAPRQLPGTGGSLRLVGNDRSPYGQPPILVARQNPNIPPAFHEAFVAQVILDPEAVGGDRCLAANINRRIGRFEVVHFGLGAKVAKAIHAGHSPLDAVRKTGGNENDLIVEVVLQVLRPAQDPGVVYVLYDLPYFLLARSIEGIRHHLPLV